MHEFWLATGNKGKISEMKVLLEKDFAGCKVFSTQDLKVFSAPPENGDSFLANARIKCRSVKSMKAEAWVLADDSGLQVAALDGLPGIHSARYAGANARDSENVAKLLKMMQLRAGTNREAKFHCEIVVMPPLSLGLEQEWVFVGELKGTIAKSPTGLHGFGYDPVFIPENETKSLAELGSGFKNKSSHRAIALRQFIAKLKTL